MNIKGNNQLFDLQLLAKIEVYRQHLINTCRLAKAIYRRIDFVDKNVYFCLPLGLESDILKEIKYKGKEIRYLELLGGHICAATFINLPLFLQEDLFIFGKAVNYEFGLGVLEVQFPIKQILLAGEVRGLKGLNKIPEVLLRKFLELRESKQNPRNNLEPFLPNKFRHTAYFVEGSNEYYQALDYLRPGKNLKLNLTFEITWRLQMRKSYYRIPLDIPQKFN